MLKCVVEVFSSLSFVYQLFQ